MNNLKLDASPCMRRISCPDAGDNAGSMHYELNATDEPGHPGGVVLGYVSDKEDHAELVNRWNAYPDLLSQRDELADIVQELRLTL